MPLERVRSPGAESPRAGRPGRSGRPWREPLVQFLGAGLAIFALSWVFGDGDAGSGRGDRIVVDGARLAQLRQSFERQWNRPPTAEELDAVVEGYVREEALYREGVKMGLDRDDTIVRRRVAQKLRFLVEDLLPPPEPTVAELEAFLASHPERFTRPSRATFAHLYFSESRRGPAAETDARRTLVTLAEAPRPGGPAGEAAVDGGDPFLLGGRRDGATRDEIESDFGPRFADALFAMEPGAWRGPVRSAYGVHLVRLEERSAAERPPLDEVRDAVTAAWLDERRRETNEQAIERIVDRYEVSRPADAGGAGG